VTLILASASPRRRDLLAAAGIDCLVRPVDVDESRWPGEAPDAYAERVAALKADAAAALAPEAITIGADTVVVAGANVLGKPRDAADAAGMIRMLSGRSHDVLTALALRAPRGRRNLIERTKVEFRPLSEAEIAWYVASGEPMDKAGGYAIQGLASRFVSRIEGSYSNVVGLPVETLVRALSDLEPDWDAS
jgi:septum formation protein